MGYFFLPHATPASHPTAAGEPRPTAVKSALILLQRARLIISPEHHAVHHAAPQTRNYSITLGWLNGPLRAVRFFETLERVIAAASGGAARGRSRRGCRAAVAAELRVTLSPIARPRNSSG